MTKAPHTKTACKGRKQVSDLIYGRRACDATWFDGRATGMPFYQPVKVECNSTKVVNAHDAALSDGRATKMQLLNSQCKSEAIPQNGQAPSAQLLKAPHSDCWMGNRWCGND